MESNLPYELIDDGLDATVKMHAPFGAGKDDISVTTSGDSLTVIDRRQTQPLLKVVQLRSPIKSDATIWDISPNQELSIKLRKFDPLPWPRLEPESGSPSAPEDGNSPANALEARRQVETLLLAAKENDLDAFKAAAALFPGESLAEVRDGNGRTALHFAAQAADGLQMVQYLLEDAHMPANLLDETGETPLGLAVAQGRVAIAEELIKHGADVSLAGSDSPAPICRAAASCSAETVRLLLENGASVDAESASGSPLLWAAGSGSSQCVDLLLQAGADPNTLGPDDTTALLMATATENAGVVRELVKAGAEVNVVAAGGVTPLHVAAEMGDLDIVKILLEAGADANAEDAGGHKPILAAASNNFREVVEALLPATNPPPDKEWTVDAIIERAQAYVEDDPSPSPLPRAASSEIAEIPAAVDPNEAEAATQKRIGDEAYAREEYTAALDAYTASLRHDTSDTKVWANRAAAALKLGDFSLAMSDARKARTIKPDNLKAWVPGGDRVGGDGAVGRGCPSLLRRFAG
eukprot:jgi/Botrbrau1/22591/Bobra.176_1s0021.1